MSTIGSLQVLLGMNTENFSAGADRAKKLIGGLGTSLKNRIVGSIGGALAGLSVGKLVRDSFQAADAMGNLSERTGIAIEQLSRLGHVAALSDIGPEDLATGLQKMMISMASALDSGEQQVEKRQKALGKTLTKGIGATSSAASSLKKMFAAVADDGDDLTGLAKTFEDLGLKVEDLINLPADEALAQIADGFAKINTQAEKLEAAKKIFGKGGLGMVQILQQGGAEIRRLAAEADRLGLTISKVKLEKIQRADDAMVRMRGAARGLGTDLAVILAPALEQAALGFQMMLQWLQLGTSALDENSAALGQNEAALNDNRSAFGRWADFLVLKLGILAAAMPSFFLAMEAAWEGDWEAFRRLNKLFTDEGMKDAEKTLLEDRRRLDAMRIKRASLPEPLPKITPPPRAPVSAISFGTQEAISAIAKFRGGGADAVPRAIERNTGRTARGVQEVARGIRNLQEFIRGGAQWRVVQF